MEEAEEEAVEGDVVEGGKLEVKEQAHDEDGQELIACNAQRNELMLEGAIAIEEATAIEDEVTTATDKAKAQEDEKDKKTKQRQGSDAWWSYDVLSEYED